MIDGLLCKKCHHSQELHIGGVELCTYSSPMCLCWKFEQPKGKKEVYSP
jgi:hypothetical protein